MPKTGVVFVGVLLALARPALAQPVVAENGMVVAAHPEAARAGLEMLEAGGNAVDAAVATAFALGVVEPWSSGIGGGGFLLLYRRLEHQTLALDFREMAPLAADREMYVRAGELRPELSQEGWLAVATPGAVAGLLHALDRFGTLPRPRVLAPAIRLARSGFPVSARHRDMAAGSLAKLRADPEAARIFLVPDPAGGPPLPPEVGHRLLQPDLASTLQRIAEEGAAGFYQGPVAEAIVRGSDAGGGRLTLEDLAAYRPTERRPVHGTYRGYTLESMPPPSSAGVVLVEVLNVLSGYDLEREAPRHPLTLHLLVEALRRAFADRNTTLGDPAFVKNPVEALTSAPYADHLRRLIDPLRATPSSEVLPFQLPEADGGTDTSHLSVVDAAGNAVALTNTINYVYGAGVVAPGTGVLMNDEMDDFAAQPGRPNVYGLVQGETNAIAPRKIPLSSMAPTLVFQGEGPERRLHLVLGAPGGPTIITTVLQIILNVIHFDQDIAQAVAAPRLHHQWLPDLLFVEPGSFPDATLAALAALGHELRERQPWGNAQCILVDPETELRYGASDPRGEGAALGF